MKLTIKEQLLKLSKITEVLGHKVESWVIKNDNDGGYIEPSNHRELMDKFEDIDEYFVPLNELTNFFTMYVYWGQNEIDTQQALIDSLGITNIEASAC